MNAMSLIISLVATAISLVAAAAAVAAFVRTVFHELPTIEFLARRDASGLASYKLSVSNPTRRLLVLDCIKVLSPSTVTGFSIPGDTAGDTLRRAYETLERAGEEAERAAGQTKSVYLEVPAGETKYLEIVFKNNMTDEGFEVDFRPVWSKGLPFLARRLMRRKVQLDSAQVKSRNLAALEGGKD